MNDVFDNKNVNSRHNIVNNVFLIQLIYYTYTERHIGHIDNLYNLDIIMD